MRPTLHINERHNSEGYRILYSVLISQQSPVRYGAIFITADSKVSLTVPCFKLVKPGCEGMITLVVFNKNRSL